MSRTLFLLIAAGLVSNFAFAAEVYRWVDDKGGVHYSDQPPPPGAKTSSKFQAAGNVVEVDKESYETKYARANSPVTLYASNCGAVCDQAQEHLRQRGIPFSVRDPSKEPEIALELKKMTGKIEVPVIKVGKQHQMGFSESSWDSMLDAAGYPKTAMPAATKSAR